MEKVKVYKPENCMAASCVNNYRVCANCLFTDIPVPDDDFCRRQFTASINRKPKPKKAKKYEK